MARVELSYNPYLLETKVLFNKKEPHINSLIEKYTRKSMYCWIKDMPTIFHDEMNGFDFELEFSGTEKDFLSIEESFKEIDNVNIFHKNRLDGRYEKNRLIGELLAWFEENPSRMFDYNTFREMNKEVFDDPYPMLIVNGGKIDETVFNGINVSVDNIDDLDNVKETDLSNVPILISINQESVLNIETNVEVLLNRTDVDPAQLFFLVHPPISVRRITRMLKDVGVSEPQIIKVGDLSLIINYLEMFPVTDFIRDAIKVMGNEYRSLKDSLDKSLADNEIAGKDTRVVIDDLSTGIESLKKAAYCLVNRDNINIPYGCANEKAALNEKIKSWRKRKTKITNDDDAVKNAAEYERDVLLYVSLFRKNIDNVFRKKRESLEESYLNIFKASGFDQKYIPNVSPVRHISLNKEFDLQINLIRLKHEKLVEQRDIFDSLFTQSKNSKLVREVTYYNHEWRECVERIVMPKIETYIEEKYKALCEYEKDVAEDLIDHIQNLIKLEVEKKQKVMSQMSEVDWQLQNDADWLETFKDKLEFIMRR